MFPYVCKSGFFTITENKTILELVCLASGRAGKSCQPAGTKYFAYRVTCSARRGRARERPVRRVFLPVPSEQGSAGCKHCTGALRQPYPHVPAARQGGAPSPGGAVGCVCCNYGRRPARTPAQSRPSRLSAAASGARAAVEARDTARRSGGVTRGRGGWARPAGAALCHRRRSVAGD